MHIDCCSDIVVDVFSANKIDHTISLQHLQHLRFYACQVQVNVPVDTSQSYLHQGISAFSIDKVDAFHAEYDAGQRRVGMHAHIPQAVAQRIGIDKEQVWLFGCTFRSKNACVLGFRPSSGM